MGHDAIASLETGKAKSAVPDSLDPAVTTDPDMTNKLIPANPAGLIWPRAFHLPTNFKLAGSQ